MYLEKITFEADALQNSQDSKKKSRYHELGNLENTKKNY